MKFVNASAASGSPQLGVLHRESFFPLPPGQFSTMLDLIAAAASAERAGHEAIAKGKGVPVASIRLLAPIENPPRLFCIGLNYASHAAESQMKVQNVPTVFMKLPEAITGPSDAVVLPANSTQPDYEAELGVVIGRPGYRIAEADAMQHVFGYTIVNDVSARDVQLATTQWTLGKSFPSFAPLGPAIVSADEIADPHALAIGLTLDGETLQSANTRDLIFRIPKLIEYISSCTPLKTGDIISTGTPEGVGLGRTPQRWLRPGELMVTTIEGIGELRNRIVAEGETR